MHVELFKALKSINIDDGPAAEVVKAVESYIAMEISNTTQPILSRIDSLERVLGAKIDAVAQVKTQQDAERDRRALLIRWVVGTTVAAVAATLGVLKAFNVI